MYLYICTKQLKNRKTNNMRKFKNYEAVKINNAEEAMEFLQYLEDNTNFEWIGGGKPTEISLRELNSRRYPIFLQAVEDWLMWVILERLLGFKTKVIPLSEFIEPKITYTKEQAEKVLEDYNQFHNYAIPLDLADNAFLNHKFPKPILEQVTEAIKQVTEAVKDLGNFTIEQTSTGEIIISPINK